MIEGEALVGLLDTSVFIASKNGRAISKLPGPISEAVMVSWARLVADCRAAGVHRAVKLTDALIAATAIEHGLPVVTQDADFDRIAGACPTLSVIRV